MREYFDNVVAQSTRDLVQGALLALHFLGRHQILRWDGMGRIPGAIGVVRGVVVVEEAMSIGLRVDVRQYSWHGKGRGHVHMAYIVATLITSP
jgi:hypothetical protein